MANLTHKDEHKNSKKSASCSGMLWKDKAELATRIEFMNICSVILRNYIMQFLVDRYFIYGVD